MSGYMDNGGTSLSHIFIFKKCFMFSQMILNKVASDKVTSGQSSI